MARHFRDQRNRAWTVWSVHPARESEAEGKLQAIHPDLAAGWLVFQGEAERRRLAPIPAGWVNLTETELAALCEEAILIKRIPEADWGRSGVRGSQIRGG